MGSHVFLLTCSAEELKFWSCNIEFFNGYNYSIQPTPVSSTLVFSDVSDAACGGFSASLGGTVASGMFTIDDLGQVLLFAN